MPVQYSERISSNNHVTNSADENIFELNREMQSQEHSPQ